MPKVICTLPNASESINGIKFVSHKQGMISEDVSEEEAKSLTSIPGYHLHDSATGGIKEGSGTPASTPAAPAAPGGPVTGKEHTSTNLTLTPEALAQAAIGFTPANRTKLINLLQAQQPPKAPAAGGKPAAGSKSGAGTSATAPAGSPPPASTAASGSTDAPTSPPSAQTTTETTGATGTSGAPENPTF